MLKDRPKMLKITKNVKILKLGKNFAENFLGNFPNPVKPENFWDPGNFPENFLKISRFLESRKSGKKKNPSSDEGRQRGQVVRSVVLRRP